MLDLSNASGVCINAFLARIVAGAWMEAPHYPLHPSPGAKEAHRIRHIQPMASLSSGLTRNRREMTIVSSSKARQSLPWLQTPDEVQNDRWKGWSRFALTCGPGMTRRKWKQGLRLVSETKGRSSSCAELITVVPLPVRGT